MAGLLDRIDTKTTNALPKYFHAISTAAALSDFILYKNPLSAGVFLGEVAHYLNLRSKLWKKTDKPERLIRLILLPSGLILTAGGCASLIYWLSQGNTETAHTSTDILGLGLGMLFSALASYSDPAYS